MDERRRVRVEKAILRELSLILRREARDPRLASVVVTRVSLSRDGSRSLVHYSDMGESGTDEDSSDETESALRSASGFIRRLVGERLSLRITPEIRFIRDDSIEGGERILRLMRELEATTDDDDGNQQNV
jgi:ribosome-binding factor A